MHEGSVGESEERVKGEASGRVSLGECALQCGVCNGVCDELP